MSDARMPDAPMPDAPMPDAAMPDTAAPDAATSGAVVPGAAVPGQAGLALRAGKLDAADELAHLRERFVTDDVVYLDGNSLGALPRSVPARVAEVIEQEWGRLRIRGWMERGWWTAPERVGDRIAPLVGAAPGQLVVGDSTSVNVFKAVVAAVRLAQAESAAHGGGGRMDVLVDAATFPTDGYIAQSAARMTGCTVHPVEAADMPAEIDHRTAAVLVNHVDFRTGRLNDLPATTRAAHTAGARIVWDVCHSAGALPVELDRDGVDFAVGCTYKYLNGGPGAPAFLYVRSEHQDRFDSPLPGWTSHAEPFAMEQAYRPAQGVARGRVGTPEILSLLALEAALDVWEGVGMEAVRAKSLALTDFFMECVAALVPAGLVEPVTPADPRLRGSQVSLRCAGAADVLEELISRGVVADARPPETLRFGFAPLYTRFTDALRAARTLADVVRDREAAGGGS
jgi:kynureninase